MLMSPLFYTANYITFLLTVYPIYRSEICRRVSLQSVCHNVVVWRCARTSLTQYVDALAFSDPLSKLRRIRNKNVRWMTWARRLLWLHAVQLVVRVSMMKLMKLLPFRDHGFPVLPNTRIATSVVRRVPFLCFSLLCDGLESPYSPILMGRRRPTWVLPAYRRCWLYPRTMYYDPGSSTCERCTHIYAPYKEYSLHYPSLSPEAPCRDWAIQLRARKAVPNDNAQVFPITPIEVPR